MRERVAPGLTEAEVLVEMYVVARRARVSGGYAGYLWIARVVPLMWPMALLGPLPGVWHLGDAVYRYVAANRVVGDAAPTTCARRSLRAATIGGASLHARKPFVIG